MNSAAACASGVMATAGNPLNAMKIDNNLRCGAVVELDSDRGRHYLVTATSPWGFCAGQTWVSWEKADAWRLIKVAR
jgi:hypothetical protein